MQWSPWDYASVGSWLDYMGAALGRRFRAVRLYGFGLGLEPHGVRKLPEYFTNSN